MTEYEISTRLPMDIAWVSDTHGFPPWVELMASGLNGGPDVFAKVEMREGVPEITEFRMTAKPNGRAVRTSDLNAWQPLEGLALNRMRLAAISRADDDLLLRGYEDEREFWKIGGDLQRAQDSRKGPSKAELEQVAQIYRAAVDGKPTEAVQVQLGLSRRTAARRVQQAREVGYLPATTAGKKNA